MNREATTVGPDRRAGRIDGAGAADTSPRASRPRPDKVPLGAQAARLRNLDAPSRASRPRPQENGGAPALDKGARALVLLFLGALVVGAIVIAVHPGYRAALRSMLPGGGGDADSPIWQSNARYYNNSAPSPDH